jgi:hypothetical protein
MQNEAWLVAPRWAPRLWGTAGTAGIFRSTRNMAKVGVGVDVGSTPSADKEDETGETRCREKSTESESLILLSFDVKTRRIPARVC